MCEGGCEYASNLPTYLSELVDHADQVDVSLDRLEHALHDGRVPAHNVHVDGNRFFTVRTLNFDGNFGSIFA